ncbi:Putative E3 ubiquitin-protein ligase UBR7 [Linum perenne]
MADVFDDETEQTVTMDEYLKGVEAEELEADLVLGGDEGKECTYNLGYMKRQAIFSCLTCTPEGNAGVCTACSLSCHDGHEFGEIFCKLCADKDVENVENSYNHNFKGLYCTCGRPYPDPDAEEQEEMIQCVLCEDWFHEEHLGLESVNEIPRDSDGEPLYDEFICKACSTVCSFLTLYPQTIRALECHAGDSTSNTNKDKGVMESHPSPCLNGKVDDNGAEMASPKDVSIEKGSSSNGSLEKNDGSSTCAVEHNVHAACVLGNNTAVSPSLEIKPLFLAKNWREQLCRCEKCLELYKEKHVSYLIDKEDSIAEYEKMAKQKREEKLQKQEGDELDLLNKLGHVEKMEILSGIADFKDEFRSFVESFDPSKTVTSTDVQQIFENLAKKRRRM